MKSESNVKRKRMLSIVTAMAVSLAMIATVLPEKSWAAETVTDATGNQYSINAGTNTLTLTRGVDQESVSIPETVSYNGADYTVTAIKNYAFPGYKNFEKLIIPKSVSSIGILSRSETPNFNTIIVDGENPNYESTDGVLFDKGKKTLICYPEGKKDTSYIIPDGVISLGGWAFSDALSLEEVILPTSVTDISSSFYLCTGLKEIFIPKNVSSIDSQAFYSCTSLRNINVDAENTYYESTDGVLFEKATSKLCVYPPDKDDASYSIPDGIVTVGDYAFFKCNNLTMVHISDTVTTIGMHCFQNSDYLEEVYIPDSVTTLGEYAFWSCIRLTKVNIPNQVHTISYNAFAHCRSLKNIVIPESVTAIDNYAFAYCPSLTSIILPNSIASIGGYAFSYSPNLSTVVLPGSITSIGSNAFNQTTANTAVFVMYDADPQAETIEQKMSKAFNNSVQWYRAQRTFTSQDPLSLTLMRGDTYQLPDGLGITDTVYSGTSGASIAADATLPFALAGANSSETYIDNQGILHIGNDEKGPLSIDAYGRRATVQVKQVESPSSPPIYYSLTADDLSFPTCTYGEAVISLPLQIHCTGNSGTTITSLELSNDSFIIDHSAADSYVEAGKTNTTYRVMPKASLEPGTYTADIKITYGYGKIATAKVTYAVALSKPSKLKALSKGYRSVALSWQKVKGAERYQIYKATSKNGTYKKISTTKKLSSLYTGLTTGKRYYYKVRAYRTVNGKKVYSGFTNIASAAPVPKTVVYTLKAGKRRITVNWKGSAGASGYKIYRATSKNGKYRLIKDTKASQRSYTSTKLKSGKSYYYKMRAYRIVSGKKVYSTYSVVKKITTK